MDKKYLGSESDMDLIPGPNLKIWCLNVPLGLCGQKYWRSWREEGGNEKQPETKSLTELINCRTEQPIYQRPQIISAGHEYPLITKCEHKALLHLAAEGNSSWTKTDPCCFWRAFCTLRGHLLSSAKAFSLSFLFQFPSLLSKVNTLIQLLAFFFFI